MSSPTGIATAGPSQAARAPMAVPQLAATATTIQGFGLLSRRAGSRRAAAMAVVPASHAPAPQTSPATTPTPVFAVSATATPPTIPPTTAGTRRPAAAPAAIPAPRAPTTPRSGESSRPSSTVTTPPSRAPTSPPVKPRAIPGPTSVWFGGSRRVRESTRAPATPARIPQPRPAPSRWSSPATSPTAAAPGRERIAGIRSGCRSCSRHQSNVGTV